MMAWSREDLQDVSHCVGVSGHCVVGCEWRSRLKFQLLVASQGSILPSSITYEWLPSDHEARQMKAQM